MEFKPQFLNLDRTKISTFINEIWLNEIFHIERVLFYLKEEKKKDLGMAERLDFGNAKLKMIPPS